MRPRATHDPLPGTPGNPSALGGPSPGARPGRRAEAARASRPRWQALVAGWVFSAAALGQAQGPPGASGEEPGPRAARLDGIAHASLAARIEVLAGRARLYAPNRVEGLFEHSPPMLVEGEVHLDVRAAARVRVTWPGRGSVEVQGPAALEWRAQAATAESGDSWAAAAPLALDVLDLGVLDIEARRGAIALTLPGSWRARLERAAVQLEGLPHGAVHLRHHAGRAVRLEWLGDRSATRPPVDLDAGSAVHLDRPKPVPGAARNEAPLAPWPAGEEGWPWRSTSDSPEAARARAEAAPRTERLEGWAGAQGHPVSHVEAIEDSGRVRLVPLQGGPRAEPRLRTSEPPRRRAVAAQVAPAPLPVHGARVEVDTAQAGRRSGSEEPAAPTGPSAQAPPAGPADPQAGASQTGASQTGASQTGASQTGASQVGALQVVPGSVVPPDGDSLATEPTPPSRSTAAGAAPNDALGMTPEVAPAPAADGPRAESPGSGTPSVGAPRFVPEAAPAPEQAAASLAAPERAPLAGTETPAPTQPLAGSTGVAEATGVTRPTAATEPAPPRADSAPSPTTNHDPALWRGLSLLALEPAGPIAVERRRGVETRALPDGRIRVLVDASVLGPVWCFTPAADLRLAPGATIVFEPNGAERLRLGTVEVHASQGRPARLGS